MPSSPAGTRLEDGEEAGRLDSLVTVVVNWRTPDLTIRCVTALQEDGVPAHRIVVVDNGSSDDSVARFERELPACPLVRIEDNVGYARAANAGARVLTGAAYLFVDNDAFVQREGSVAALVRCLDDHSVGVAAARLLAEDLTVQHSVYPIQTPAVALVLASGIGRLLPNRWQPRWGRHWDHSESRAISSASGAAMLVRAEAWQELVGFAEDALLYAEDIDLCWRANIAGWTVWFTTDAEFVHLSGGSTSSELDDVQSAEMIARAEVSMTRRNLGPVSASLVLSLSVLGSASRWLCYRAAGKRAGAAIALATLRGCLLPSARSDD